MVGGVLDVPGTTMLEKMRWLEAEGDELRRLLLFEPRGSAPLSLDIVLPSAHPEADAGFLIMESCSYEGMSGSNTINTATVLLETGIVPMTEPVTDARARGARRPRARHRRLPRRALRARDVRERAVVRHPPRRAGGGARGSASCRSTSPTAARSARSSTPRRSATRSCPEEARELADLGERIRPAVAEQLEIAHPAEPALSALSFVVFTAAPRAGGDARNATVVAPGRLDRSATGTATSARLAVLAARGLIGDGEEFVNESVIGTRFVGRIVGRTHGRRRRGDRARDLRPRVDHRHAPVRARPRRPVPGGLPAARHLGRRPRRMRLARPLARGRRGGARPRRARRRARGRAFAALSAGEVSMPPRAGVEVPGDGHDPADGRPPPREPVGDASSSSRSIPGHDPAHQAAIVVFDAATGTPAALMDGDAITAARTAAGSRLATRLLARDGRRRARGDRHRRAGRGAPAGARARARMGRDPRVGPPRGPRPRASPRATSATPVAARARTPSRGAGVVCVATPATEPVLRREWLAPGAHVNSVGYSTAGRELDPALVRDALVVVESRESALAPPPAGSTDLEGADAHAELGELVAGTAPGRTSPEQLTLYKSVGVGARGRRRR